MNTLAPESDERASSSFAVSIVVPTYGEAENLRLLIPQICEAMATGLTVISCRVGGIPKIIRSPEEGELAPPRDPKRLALLRDKRRRSVLSTGGVCRANDFDVTRMIARPKDLYLQVSEERRMG